MMLSLSNSLQVGTTVLQSPRDGRSRNAKFVSPIGDALRTTIPRNESRISPIALLFSPTRPSAIFWAVVSVWINSVNRITVWARTHVVQEVLKRIPSLANSDPSTTVRIVVGKLGIIAAASHSKPHPVKRVPFATSCVTVFNRVFHTWYNTMTGYLFPIAESKLKQLPAA